jgi:hypothetical protein
MPNLVTEGKFFDAMEYLEVTDIVDGIIVDTLYPDNVCSTYVGSC